MSSVSFVKTNGSFNSVWIALCLNDMLMSEVSVSSSSSLFGAVSIESDIGVSVVVSLAIY